MIKKIIIGILVVAILGLGAYKIFFSKDSGSSKLNGIGDNLTSYHMEATMEVSKNDDDMRNYFVTTDYLKKDDKENFRISLLDKNINQEQIVLRNNDGVFVLTPTLNQVYKFKGDYPLNGPKPYLYHSMVEIVKGEHELKEATDGYLVTATPKYENAPTWVKEEIKLSKDLKPMWVNIYSADNALLVKVTFSKVDFNPTFTDEYFSVKENMDTAKSNASSSELTSFEDLPFIPTNTPVSATLKEQTLASISGKQAYIMTYEGDKPFTVVQSVMKANEEMVEIEVDGDYVEQVYGVCFIKGYNLTYMYKGVCYQIYSKVLTVSEMVQVTSSMEEAMYKE